MDNTVESFSNLCISAYECWRMHKIMCDYKVDDQSGIWTRFGIILQHYLILQIAKINDHEKHGKDYNLSLEYFVAHVAAHVNKSNYTDSYNEFGNDNKEFIEAIREARNKVVAHSDWEIYTSDALVGAFSEGLDKKYFDSLHKIVSDGYKELSLGPFPKWPSFIVNDTKIFMNKLSRIFDAQQSS